jgi:hypothetical protein
VSNDGFAVVSHPSHHSKSFVTQAIGNKCIGHKQQMKNSSFASYKISNLIPELTQTKIKNLKFQNFILSNFVPFVFKSVTVHTFLLIYTHLTYGKIIKYRCFCNSTKPLKTT